MKRLMAFLLVLLTVAGLLCGAAGAASEETAEGETFERLPDEVLMTFFDGTVFAGDSQFAKFRNFVKKKWKTDPGFFSNVDFRVANSYKFRFAAYKTLKESESAHLTDGGKKTTLYAIVKKVKPEKLFVLAGLNDAFTTDYTKKRNGTDETGYDRAARYVREMTALVREASPGTEIYIISQMPITKSFVQGSNRYEKCRDRFDLVNETVRQECETLGIRYVDLATGLKDEEGLLPVKYCADGLCHLNDAGYEIFSQELLDFVQAEYEAGRWTPAENPGTEEE